MATYGAEEIYRFARAAGFSPDQAVTMTAIALAESGGNTQAHNPVGEDSRGLWQINMKAHASWLGDADLYDPMVNARAAFEISKKGQDISPWTVTHKGDAARYLKFKDEAQAAAVAAGDPPDLGVWTGTVGYGHPVPAGEPGTGARQNVFDLSEDDDSPRGDLLDLDDDEDGPPVAEFVRYALAQDGDKYVFGHEVDLDDDDPDTFDCSELVQWAAHQAGVEVPDGSWLQYLHLKQAGTTMSVEEALKTPGALLFSFSSEPTPGGARPEKAHVAISLGDGRTIEAKGTKWGVGQFDAGDPGERFKYAGYIAGFDYTDIDDALSTVDTTMRSLRPDDDLAFFARGVERDMREPRPRREPIDPNSPDSDGDGLTDSAERRLGLDPNSMDSDNDGASDAYELVELKTNPLRADSDFDGVTDSMELVLGLDPLLRDTDGDGRLDSDGLLLDTTDTDGDKLTDELELILGSDPNKIDTDGDGFADGLEYEAGTDLLSAKLHSLSDPDGTMSIGIGMLISRFDADTEWDDDPDDDDPDDVVR